MGSAVSISVPRTSFCPLKGTRAVGAAAPGCALPFCWIGDVFGRFRSTHGEDTGVWCGLMQELQQGVCARYGWSSRFFRGGGEDGAWGVEVQVRPGDLGLLSFLSTDTSPDTKAGAKQGKRAAAEAALAGLTDEIARMEEMPELTLAQAVGANMRQNVRVLSSSKAAWEEFWASDPHVVGIDVEGNHQCPPVLVQIATRELVILEAPGRLGISPDLHRLLDDPKVRKAFCDGPGQSDKKSLGIQPDAADESVVDLETLAAERMGVAGVARGFCRIFSLFCSETVGFRLIKEKGSLNSVGLFTAVEQGRTPPLESADDPRLRAQDREYAALDAWGTLMVYCHISPDQQPWEVAWGAQPVSTRVFGPTASDKIVTKSTLNAGSMTFSPTALNRPHAAAPRKKGGQRPKKLGNGGAAAEGVVGTSQKLCRFFAQGCCNRGEECRFSHDS